MLRRIRPSRGGSGTSWLSTCSCSSLWRLLLLLSFCRPTFTYTPLLWSLGVRQEVRQEGRQAGPRYHLSGTPPAGELVRFPLPGQVEVQAEVGVDAQPEVVVHLDDLQADER